MKKIESNEKKIETSGVLKGDSDENNIRFFSPDRGLSEYNYKIFKNYFKKKITKKKK